MSFKSHLSDIENSKSEDNDGLSTTTRSIADLTDKQLSEIFIRLPCYESVIRCKFVSKHWLSLLSNPKFVIEFVNHKKTTRQPYLPWTFISLAQVKLIKNDDDDDNQTNNNGSFIDTHNKVFYSSPKFSLNFLALGMGLSRSSFKIAATFKDLILCVDVSSGRYYFICNPVTKHWVALPPIPPSPSTHRSWACLTCEDPYNNNNNNNNIDDYMFRIVVVLFPEDGYKILPYGEKYPFITLKVFVFCSENSQWIDVDVRLPLHTLGKPCRTSHPTQSRSQYPLKGVLCKGMVCLCFDVYFGMFNPFNVTPTTAKSTTIIARFLPIPYFFSISTLVEWGGRLISVRSEASSPTYHKDKEGNLLVDYTAGITVEICYQELDLNRLIDNDEEVDVYWTNLFCRRYCIDKTGRSRSVLDGIRMINVHPNNKCLFFILTAADELLLCDTRSCTMNSLGRRLQSSNLTHKSCSHRRLELQYWPTPVPMLLSVLPSDNNTS